MITFIIVTAVLMKLLLVGIFFLNLEIVDILRFLKKDAQIKTLMDLDIPGVILDKMKGLNEKLKTFKDEQEKSEAEA